jgi:hypothetical protein
MVQLIFVGKLDGSFDFLRESAAMKHGTNMSTDIKRTCKAFEQKLIKSCLNSTSSQSERRRKS